MSEYKNFNNYELTEPVPEKKDTPADNYVKADTYESAPGGFGAGADGQNGGADIYGILSVVLAPLSCCFVGLPAVVGIVLGILGLRKNKNSVLCIIGIILCTLAVIYMGYFIIMMIRDPEMYQQLMDEYMAAIEESARVSGTLFRK